MADLRPTRRQFTLALATGLGACATARAPAGGVAPTPAPAAMPSPAPAPTATAPVVVASQAASQPAPAPEPERPEVEARLALLGVLTGSRLSAEELTRLRKPVKELVQAAAKLRAHPLPNSAEPHGGWIGNPGGAT